MLIRFILINEVPSLFYLLNEEFMPHCLAMPQGQTAKQAFYCEIFEELQKRGHLYLPWRCRHLAVASLQCTLLYCIFCVWVFGSKEHCSGPTVVNTRSQAVIFSFTRLKNHLRGCHFYTTDNIQSCCQELLNIYAASKEPTGIPMGTYKGITIIWKKWIQFFAN